MSKRRATLPFGTLLGVAPPGVPAYSSDYSTAERGLSRRDFVAFHEGRYTGYKYQCVEYARRWLQCALNVTFEDVGMAYEIFELEHFLHEVPQADGSCRSAERDDASSDDERSVVQVRRLPVLRCRNGAVLKGTHERPRLGSVIVWREGGYFRHTGHVAIVTAATDDYVRVAEQNVHDSKWNDRDHSRELPVVKGPRGEYDIVDPVSQNSVVLGWLNLDEEHQRQLEAARLQHKARI